MKINLYLPHFAIQLSLLVNVPVLDCGPLPLIVVALRSFSFFLIQFVLKIISIVGYKSNLDIYLVLWLEGTNKKVTFMRSSFRSAFFFFLISQFSIMAFNASCLVIGSVKSKNS